MTLEAASLGGQGSPGLVADEQPTSQCLFERLNSGADGGLGDEQPFTRLDEIAGGNHCEKSACEFRVHEPGSFAIENDDINRRCADAFA